MNKEEEAGKSESKTEYDTKCEVYSFGILLWEIAECKPPYSQFEDIEEITREVISGYRESFTEETDVPDKYQNLVRQAVDYDPNHRPTFAKLLIDLQDIFKEYTPARRLSSFIKSAININYIKWNKLADISKLGSGHFGSVSKARWLNTNDYVVIKKLNGSSDIQEDALQHEIKMLNKAHACENIIRFIGITQGMLFVLLYR